MKYLLVCEIMSNSFQIIMIQITFLILPIFTSSLRLASCSPGLSLGLEDRVKSWNCLKRWTLKLMECTILVPFHSILLVIRKETLQYLFDFKNIDKPKLVEKWENLNENVRLNLHADLGLETMAQFICQTILLALAFSKTRTFQSLMPFFRPSENPLLPIEVWVACSILLSASVFIRGQVRGLSYHRECYPIRSMVVRFLYVTVSLFVRTMSIILFFTPPLGLFNTLRHYQSEQITWSSEIYNEVDFERDFLYFGA